MRTFITFITMLATMENTSLYVILPTEIAIEMNGVLHGNSRFIARPTIGGTWVTSANGVSDPNFIDFFDGLNHLHPLDTISIPVDSFPKPDTTILK